MSEAQFNQMFPSRNSFYTYSGLKAALSAYPAFANTGSDTVKKQEAAAFLANVSHETGGLVHIVEQNTANYPHYCDWGQPYGCPAGQAAYYGRGPIQLSWNFNYKAAGDALGIDLLEQPLARAERRRRGLEDRPLVLEHAERPRHHDRHNAMVNGAGFGQTIRSINGSLECDGKNPAQVQSRVNNYQRFTQILGVDAGQQPVLLRYRPGTPGGRGAAARCRRPVRPVQAIDRYIPSRLSVPRRPPISRLPLPAPSRC